jgi:CHAT domain-containing protein
VNGRVFCQCHDLLFYTGRFNTIYNSATRTSADQLKELLQLETKLINCGYAKDSLHVTVLQKIGLLYYKQSDFTRAVAYTQRSILSAKDLMPGHTMYDNAVVQSYYNLNFYYESLHQPEKKQQAIDDCIAYALKKSTAYDVACQALETKTNDLFNKGDYSFCIVNAKLGEALVKKYYHEDDSLSYINSFIISRANSLYISHKLSALKTLLGTREKEMIKAKNIDPSMPVIYSFLASLYNERGDFKNALFYFEKAYKGNMMLKFRPGIAENLDDIGILYAKGFKQFDKGLYYCNRALNYADSTTVPMVILKNIANIYALKGNYNEARAFFQRSFNTLGKNIDETKLGQGNLQFDGFNVYQDILDLITDKGTAFQQQYQTTKNKAYLNIGISVFKNGDRFLTRLKEEQGLQFESNLVWRFSAHHMYEQAIEACYQNNDIESAFYFFERSRAVLLNDQLNAEHKLQEADITKTAILNQEISQLNTDLGQQPDDESQHRLALLKDLYTKSTEQEALTHQLSLKKVPSLKNNSDTIPVTIQQVRQQILVKGTLLEIFTGDSAIYTLTITPDAQLIQKLNKAKYDSLSKSFIPLVSKPALYQSDFNVYIKAAHQLYSFLFGANKLPGGRVIISPDARFFPFEALVTGEKNNKPSYFIEKYVTSYTYSARYLINAYSINNGNSFLGIAPVRFSPSMHLAELLGSDASLENIKSYFGDANNMTSKKATKSGFLRHFADYNIIQLYTHATDSSFRNDPVIYFADSALYLSQLTSTKKPVAQLIVLSACKTANGQLYEGEGIFSFNRSFAALGIPAAISNLWSVDNQSTYKVTELFYKYLSSGSPTDLALQRAKLEFISTSSTEKQFPYYWAATVLVGKSNTVIPSKSGSFYLIILGCAVLAGISYFAYKRIKNPTKVIS